MRFALFVMLGLGAAGSAIFLFDDFNRFGTLGSRGFIESGSVFDIAIGMDRAGVAHHLLARGLERGEPTTPGRCLDRDNPPGEDVDTWDDRSWRHGVICLSSKGGKITSIAWSYGGWQL